MTKMEQLVKENEMLRATILDICDIIRDCDIDHKEQIEEIENVLEYSKLFSWVLPETIQNTGDRQFTFEYCDLSEDFIQDVLGLMLNDADDILENEE